MLCRSRAEHRGPRPRSILFWSSLPPDREPAREFRLFPRRRLQGNRPRRHEQLCGSLQVGHLCGKDRTQLKGGTIYGIAKRMRKAKVHRYRWAADFLTGLDIAKGTWPIIWRGYETTLLVLSRFRPTAPASLFHLHVRNCAGTEAINIRKSVRPPPRAVSKQHLTESLDSYTK